ncbi:hypothetical protein AAG747_18130 [Rapidithrix thailandica]|uniref:Uncharacterized protein n=1 Tax=Rapidithrix thailandica TaxID=413964 RepID=A0AAW9SA42_9BACT
MKLLPTHLIITLFIPLFHACELLPSEKLDCQSTQENSVLLIRVQDPGSKQSKLVSTYTEDSISILQENGAKANFDVQVEYIQLHFLDNPSVDVYNQDVEKKYLLSIGENIKEEIVIRYKAIQGECRREYEFLYVYLNGQQLQSNNIVLYD